VSIIVFLGPTLPHDEGRRLLDATFLPPAAMGDVVRALDRAPQAILLVDGVFERTPAVWHKEILYALSRGVRVFGASSMGALRAAELAAFGMEGCGRIFEMFASGDLEDDDEVAVAHADAGDGFRAGSDAMVNVRYALGLAGERGIVSASSIKTLTVAAKKTFYAERSFGTLLSRGAELGVPPAEIEALSAFVRQERPDLKRRDAVGLLEHVAALGPHLARHEPRFTFESTAGWAALLAGRAPDGRGYPWSPWAGAGASASCDGSSTNVSSSAQQRNPVE
jgi:hypothetical protein